MTDNSNKFKELREKYNTFIYESFSIKNTSEEFIMKFKFTVPNLTTYEPEIKILKNNLDIEINEQILENAKNAVFHIGLIELIS